MTNRLILAVVLVCLFAFGAIAAPAEKAASTQPKNSAMTSTSADTGTDDGMPRVARNQIRRTVLHTKTADDGDVFSPDFSFPGSGGGGATPWTVCSTGSRCSVDACTTQNATYNSCQDSLSGGTASCRSC